jgi:hypothetical protein
MISNENVINYKVVHLIENYNFDIKVVFIQKILLLFCCNTITAGT